jgi:hypothetical protein
MGNCKKLVTTICLTACIFSSSIARADSPSTGSKNTFVIVSERVTPATFDRIKPGMTRQQVFALMGRAPNVHFTPNDVRAWVIAADGGAELWRTDGCKIWVSFDKRGLSQHKMMCRRSE